MYFLRNNNTIEVWDNQTKIWYAGSEWQIVLYYMITRFGCTILLLEMNRHVVEIIQGMQLRHHCGLGHVPWHVMTDSNVGLYLPGKRTIQNAIAVFSIGGYYLTSVATLFFLAYIQCGLPNRAMNQLPPRPPTPAAAAVGFRQRSSRLPLRHCNPGARSPETERNAPALPSTNFTQRNAPDAHRPRVK